MVVVLCAGLHEWHTISDARLISYLCLLYSLFYFTVNNTLITCFFPLYTFLFFLLRVAVAVSVIRRVTRVYLPSVFLDLNAVQRASADASSAGIVDALFEDQIVPTRRQLDNQKQIADIHHDTQIQ